MVIAMDKVKYNVMQSAAQGEWCDMEQVKQLSPSHVSKRCKLFFGNFWNLQRFHEAKYEDLSSGKYFPLPRKAWNKAIPSIGCLHRHPQTVDKYGSELSTLAAIFLPYKVICILFSHKNYFSHVQVALVASSYVSILPISLNSCTQKWASPAFLPFPDHAAWYTLNHDVP